MSTKKTTAKATTCAGCEKRDALLIAAEKRITDLNNTSKFWHSEWYDVCVALRKVSNERNALQSRIDIFTEVERDIRAVCVEAGITHADKVATLTAVKALAGRKQRVITERTTHIIPTPYEPSVIERLLPWFTFALSIAIAIRVFLLS